MCIRDDLHLGCIIDRLHAEGVWHVNVYTPDHYYNGQGLPAYPVKTNSDKLLIGIRNDERFRCVRSVCHPEFVVTVSARLAHHFTAVRKTYADLVAKMRMSAHYSDSNYDFEDWIRDVLPNIGPE
jgi:hypothetical protein